jgi:hypothetical protein
LTVKKFLTTHFLDVLITLGMNFLPDQLKIEVAEEKNPKNHKIIYKNAVYSVKVR